MSACWSLCKLAEDCYKYQSTIDITIAFGSFGELGPNVSGLENLDLLCTLVLHFS